MEELKRVRVVLVRDSEWQYGERKLSSFSQVKDFAINELELDRETQEVVIVIGLNIHNVINGIKEVSRGTTNVSIFPVAEIAKFALLTNSDRVIVLHNHPSGELTFSKDDERAERAIEEALSLFGIPVIDFIIVGDGNAKSFVGGSDEE